MPFYQNFTQVLPLRGGAAPSRALQYRKDPAREREGRRTKMEVVSTVLAAAVLAVTLALAVTSKPRR
ncbi:hypothetical protein [Subdoligranulum variabile]|uniref:Uncharacterized protein n=1 Tax=Subdoligranulum variabile DSM 15176 TaxID=411471 RepID=D1PS52_9FIRM|nr:hypothetical protein [Subdoligranulum variabile]EFB74483.1 hypothetical protein SUBVAR_07235 [Subdoligranulum variabile DSM 15176]UWP69517.1 hypothetical protein NQ490_06630 [Subdoligranulum variabile]